MISMLRGEEIQRALVKNSIFIIGTVQSVDGRTVKVSVFKNKNSSHILFDGKIIKNISVGSYIKIRKGFVDIIGKVEGEEISEDHFHNSAYRKSESKINRILQISLYGHFENGRFIKGIKEMPLIENECFLLNREEFNYLHQFHKTGEETISIGSLTEEPTQEIKLAINKLFASHIGIFGNTGSGKSNTLARLYTNLFFVKEGSDRFLKRSTFVIIDFSGEYAQSETISSNKDIYKLSTRSPEDRYPILRKNIEKIETIAVLLEATEKNTKTFSVQIFTK